MDFMTIPILVMLTRKVRWGFLWLLLLLLYTILHREFELK